VQRHKFRGGAEFSRNQHFMGKPDFLRIAAEHQSFDIQGRRSAHIVKVTQMGLYGVNSTTGLIKVFTTNAEVVLHDPGGVAEREQVVGFVEVTVQIQPAVLQWFGMKS
jgi:hypothetical protein